MIEIRPGKVAGRLRAPASKSLTQRAVLLAAVAEGESSILHASSCEDAEASVRVARALGASVCREGSELRVSPGPAAGGTVDCGESGFCMRAAPPLAALSGADFVLTASGSLARRPTGDLHRALRGLGAECGTENGLPPVRVRGPLRGGRARVDGSETSQFLSGLLMALPRCPEDSTLEVRDLKSLPYAAMTLDLVRAYGGSVGHDAGFTRFHIPGGQSYAGRDVTVEADWSGAAFLLVAGAVAGEVVAEGLSPESLQADRAILRVLALAGAEVVWEKGGIRAGRDELHAFAFDATHCPDLFPCLAVLACACAGESRIAGVGRLRHKETDRASALVDELGKIGGRLRVEDDILLVEGTELRGGEADSRGDHRIAMALAVAGLISREGVRIRGASCVAKSYPGFFEVLAKVVKS